MDEILLDDAAYYGISVGLRFKGDRPNFGDLFLICGGEHPRFPPSGRFRFEALADLGFEQVDDSFGIRNEEDEGDDIKVSLAPLVGEAEVYHHSGPFDAIRLSYSILRNPPENAVLFLDAISAFARELPVRVLYNLRALDIAMVRTELGGNNAVVAEVLEVRMGFDVGSSPSLTARKPGAGSVGWRAFAASKPRRRVPAPWRALEFSPG